MDYGEDMVVAGAWLIGVDNTVFEAAFGKFPEFQAPEVDAGIPEFESLADMVGLRFVCAEIVVEERTQDFWIALRLLQKRRDFSGNIGIGGHQAAQIISRVGMQRQGSDNA